MEKTINFINIEYQEVVPDLIDQSSRLFKNINRIDYKKIKKTDINYLPIPLLQPWKAELLFKQIPNDIILLMQQGLVRPLIINSTEQWDLFNTYAWRYNKQKLTPDFGGVPYSTVVRNFTNRSISEESITWIVEDNNYIKQIEFLKSKGYKISCKFLELNYYLEIMRDVARKYTISNRDFKKHYNCLCYGTRRNHRYGMIYNLWQQKLLSNGNISCSPYEELVETKNSNWIDDAVATNDFMSNFPEWNTNKDKFVNLLPLSFDNKKNTHWDIDNYDESIIFENAFLWIASETKKTQDGICITEKTWKAIAYGSPFCINGDSGSLRYLKEIGFKTFDNFWDESYDHEDNDITKIKKITNIVKNICGKTLLEINELYNKMLPILKYNQEHLRNYPQYDNLIKALKNGQ